LVVCCSAMMTGLWVWSSPVRRTIICLWCQWMEFCEKLVQVSN
jgi:hypothetical protein